MNNTTNIIDINFSPSALKRLRKRNKLTQGELAQIVGKTGTRIYEYENGIRTPCGTMLLRLMIALQASASDLSHNSGRPELSPHNSE